MAEFKETYPGAKFNADGKHVGPGPWLDVIRKANGIHADEHGGDGPFGAPRYENDDYSVEIYDFATVSHDFPCPPGPPIDHLDCYSREREVVARERDRLRDEWLRDPRNTVTIVSKTPDGERLLRRAHDAVVNPFQVVGSLSYDPETDTLS